MGKKFTTFAILLLAALVCAPTARAQVANLNSCSNTTAWTQATTVSCTIASVHANSLLVAIAVSCQKGAGNFCTNGAYSTSQVISDTAGLTYTQRFHSIINSLNNSWTVGDQSFSDAQAGAFSGSDTFTATFGASQISTITVYEFSNVQTSGFFDVKNLVSTASVCSLPVGTNLVDPITPTGGALTNVTWTINIGCVTDAGAIGMAVAYHTTLGTALIVAQGSGGSFANMQPPFTQLGGGTSGTGFLEIPVTSSGIKRIKVQIY